MAIYHCSVKLIKRSAGRSVTAAAAYRAGVVITDERTGQQNDYRRKGGVDHTAIFAPSHAPAWVHDRSQLWNAVEHSEKRKDAQLAREVEVALPRELNKAQQIELLEGFVKKHFVERGMVADVALHHAQGDNPHAHILLSLRDVNPDGFGKKNRDWNSTELLEDWRKAWEQETNQSLKKNHVLARVDHRSLEAQGIDRQPTIKLGATVHQLEQKGIQTERGNLNRRIKQLNQQREQVSAEIIDLEEQRLAREQLKQERQQQKAEKAKAALSPENIEKTYQAVLADIEKALAAQHEQQKAAMEQADKQWSEHFKQRPNPPQGLFARFKQKAYERSLDSWEKQEKALRFKRIDAKHSYEGRGMDINRNPHYLANQQFKTQYPELAKERERLKQVEREQQEQKLKQEWEQRQKSRQHSRGRGMGR